MGHGVDPLVFAGLHLARLPLLLAALAAVVRRAWRRRPVLGMTGLFLGLGVFPYAYVLAFGHDLPAWMFAVVAAIGLLTIAQVVRKLRGAFPTGLIPATENDS